MKFWKNTSNKSKFIEVRLHDNSKATVEISKIILIQPILWHNVEDEYHPKTKISVHNYIVKTLETYDEIKKMVGLENINGL